MSTHYLMDLHSSVIGASRPLDVQEQGANPTLLNGGFVIRVPDYISVQNPIDASDLTSKKSLGLLAYYAGFTYVTYDGLLDTADVDFTEPTLKGKFGERNNICLPPVGAAPPGRFQSTVAVLSGPAPSQVIVTWEVYRVVLADPALDRALLTYVEEPASSLTCEVTFDNWVNDYTATDGAVLNVPPIGQGTNFSIRLSNPSTTDHLYVGSWAVIY